MANVWQRSSFIILMLLFELLIFVLFVCFTKFDPMVTGSLPPKTSEDLRYSVFQDVHVMIFVGFGFLMTFLKKYAFSALGFTFLLSCLVIQWGILCLGFFTLHSAEDKIVLDIKSLINGDEAAAVVLISFGAVLGKTSAIQLLMMAIIETPIFAANEYFLAEYLQAVDAGGSVFIHAFGAFFGLAVAAVLDRNHSVADEKNNLQTSTYQSDINAMIGTLFLWMFWPSFNAALLDDAEKYRAIINTYLAITTSCISAFLFSFLLSKSQRFNMVHIQNATLAGGVAVGTTSNMILSPFLPLVVGHIAGVVSTVLYVYQDSWMKKIRLHDTCGVFNLHGVPGLMGGLFGILLSTAGNKENYGDRLAIVFPAMGPETERSPEKQCGIQALALFFTLGVSIIGGLVTGGIVMKMLPLSAEEEFDDEAHWELEEGENK